MFSRKPAATPTVITLDFFATLPQSIAKHLSASLYLPSIEQFADGELRIDIDKNQIPGNSAIIVHPLCPPVHDNFMKFALCVQSLHAHAIDNITAVIPYIGYSRQMFGVHHCPGAAHMIARLIEATGIKRLITCALHDEDMLKLFTIPVTHLGLEDCIIDTIKKNFSPEQLREIVLIAPDHGAQHRVAHIARALNCAMALYTKKRVGPDQPKIVDSVWQGTGTIGIIIDDIIDTANTMLEVVDDLKNHGITSAYGFGIHPVFSRDACARISMSALQKLFVCNTIEGIACAGDKITFVDAGPYIAAEIIKN